ncbi:hypothetical protein [Caproicibacterium sp. XB2]|uniref:hypothetical protein n=1 Tax=Caproicibacterium sp. XB2 TaxID=3388458 RepID=UPI00384CB2EF
MWTRSLPTRERGLKLYLIRLKQKLKQVAPYTGAWIEIPYLYPNSLIASSLPTRERGLKSI